MRHWLFPFTVLLWMSFSSGCSHSSGPSRDGGADSGTLPESPDAGSPLPEASVQVPVTVPEGLNTYPFNSPRTLLVPPGFSISVFARVPDARFIALAPNGDVLVSQPDQQGMVKLLRPRAGQTPAVFDWASGLRRPHDIVFHTRAGTTWVYVSETHRVTRSVWTPGETVRGDATVLVDGLPDSSADELQGKYGHELKNIAVDSEGRLYISIASTCNACLSDTQSTPQRAAIYRYAPDGTGGQLFAGGLRNAEGLAFEPGTDQLWVTVNGRDNIPYPHDDGTGKYGQVLAEYVDNHPPESLTRVREGGRYGWPFCNPNPDTASGMKQMPFDRDYNLNRTGSVDCAQMDRVDQGIQAHSAPLGLLFLQGTSFPEPYTPGLVVAYHGSWNHTQGVGYKVAHFGWDAATRQPTGERALVKGWVGADNKVWGRPVDMAVLPDGALLISDDRAGALYLLRKD
ncbi:PQQ-dependent sugar dehydrogenase [Stigmatella aurantiaca]|uniref:Glucose/sorbosone dehydrogenase-like protein n=3 Tax=Stigmatella aurantiaca TaxID=41 RepID=E3FKF3_STIAD|nr:PQQ-dependent sugar dehydrogenase [Stigmatella aurantiaca]ADO67926.1 Glucose/sorbosone dehydrogenase-like protein [Stigmatella aurantiaca DW4/3-1]